MASGSVTFGEKLNSRKLLIAISFELIAVMLLIAGLIQAEHWVTVTITIGGAYMATQAWVDKENGKADYGRT